MCSGYFLAFALISLYSFSLPVCVFFPWSRAVKFQHGPCAGVVLRRSAWSRGAPSGIAALCVACVSVIVSVNSSVLVRVFHLKSWAGPLFFRESAELQSPMEVATPPAQLFHCFSTGSIEEQPTPPSLTLLLVGRAGW